MYYVCLSEVLILQFPIKSDIFSSPAMQGYIFFKKAVWGGIIFVPSAKNWEDFCANIDKIKDFLKHFLTNFEFLKDYSLTIQYKSRYFNVLLEFGLEDFDFKFRNNMFVASLGWGIFSLQYYSLLIIRLCADFQLYTYP